MRPEAFFAHATRLIVKESGPSRRREGAPIPLTEFYLTVTTTVVLENSSVVTIKPGFVPFKWT